MMLRYHTAPDVVLILNKGDRREMAEAIDTALAISEAALTALGNPKTGDQRQQLETMLRSREVLTQIQAAVTP